MAKSKSKKKKNRKSAVKNTSSDYAQKTKLPKSAITRAPAVRKSKTKTDSVVPDFIIKTRQFLREVKIELQKVNWPGRKETIASTTVVIVLVFLVSAYLGVVDIGLSRLIKYILR